MNCIVTAGPTYETLDQVRRLTNFATARLGTELAAFLSDRNHDVTLLVAEQAIYTGERRAKRVETFTTTASLREALESMASDTVHAVFHTAAVSDFMFGKIWSRPPNGPMTEVKAGKLSSRHGTLLAELVPTPKIIAGLRNWFPQARLVGWKFEVNGSRADVIRAAERQIAECLTDVSVANGPAYGAGFGLVRRGGKCDHVPDAEYLFEVLAGLTAGC